MTQIYAICCEIFTVKVSIPLGKVYESKIKEYQLGYYHAGSSSCSRAFPNSFLVEREREKTLPKRCEVLYTLSLFFSLSFRRKSTHIRETRDAHTHTESDMIRLLM